MPDSTLVLPPGWRATDVNGVPLPGAVLIFYDALTDDAREVFGLASLVVGSTLGNEITCDAGGYPTSDGNSKTLIWTGISPYRIRLETADAVQVFDHDLVTGALDTSSFGGEATISTPVVNTSTAPTINAAANGKLYNLNCSGADISVAMGLAAVLGDGFRVGFRHAGTANQIKLASGNSAEGFILPGMRGTDAGITTAVTTDFALTTFGQEVWIRCDGANFSVGEPTPPMLDTAGVIKIVDRLSTPPGSPEAGARYLVTTSPTDAWASFALHDIAESDGGGGWIRYTPATDCGQLAYVQDEDSFYAFQGSAWLEIVRAATAAEMEAATSLTANVTPGLMHRHPGVAKAHIHFNMATAAITDSYNVGSITDNATGDFTINFTNVFSGTNNYSWSGGNNMTVIGVTGMNEVSRTASTFRVQAILNNAANDPTSVSLQFFGDQ